MPLVNILCGLINRDVQARDVVWGDVLNNETDWLSTHSRSPYRRHNSTLHRIYRKNDELCVRIEADSDLGWRLWQASDRAAFLGPYIPLSYIVLSLDGEIGGTVQYLNPEGHHFIDACGAYHVNCDVSDCSRDNLIYPTDTQYRAIKRFHELDGDCGCAPTTLQESEPIPVGYLQHTRKVAQPQQPAEGRQLLNL